MTGFSPPGTLPPLPRHSSAGGPATGSECQIIIEDGMVKDAEPTLPPVTEKPQQKSWTKGAF